MTVAWTSDNETEEGRGEEDFKELSRSHLVKRSSSVTSPKEIRTSARILVTFDPKMCLSQGNLGKQPFLALPPQLVTLEALQYGTRGKGNGSMTGQRAASGISQTK